jgi:hypothetical protein
MKFTDDLNTAVDSSNLRPAVKKPQLPVKPPPAKTVKK